MSTPYRPEWACKHYGDYEHDWLDCPECLEAYEWYLEMEHDREPPLAELPAVEEAKPPPIHPGDGDRRPDG